MQLLVGLGNPGNQYEQTRHNVGFRFVDALGRREGLRFSAAPRFRAETAAWEGPEGRVLLVKPQTFMNNSGECVGPLARYYNVETRDIFVCYDDLDLPRGAFRLKTGGGHGGHNGLKSLHQHLPDAGYRRIRIGIGRPPAGMEVTPWVLGRITDEERASERQLFAAILDALDSLLAGDLPRASNQIHLHLREQ